MNYSQEPCHIVIVSRSWNGIMFLEDFGTNKESFDDFDT